MNARQSEWQVPAVWWRRGEAFHGRSPKPKSAKSAAKAGPIDDLIARATGRFDETIDHAATPRDLASAARAFVAGRASGDGATPLGAAVALTALTDYHEYKMRTPLVDYVIAKFGPAFAAETVVLAAGLELVSQELRPDRSSTFASVGLRVGDDLRNVQIGDGESHVRTALAALPTDDYAAVASVIGDMRGPLLGRNLVASFLMPTEKTWIAEDLEHVTRLHRYYTSYGGYLLAGVDSLEGVEKILALEESRDHAIWQTGMGMNLVYALCANIGPGVESFIGELFDGNLSAQHKKWCAAILSEFDTDAGFEELLTRLDRKYIQPAVIDAMERAPRRAARLLSASTDPRAAALRSDLGRLHPEFAEDLPATVQDFDQSDVPTLLAEPPWIDAPARPKSVILHLDSPSQPLRTAWKPGEQKLWAESGDTYPPYLGHRTWPSIVAEFARGGTYWSLSEISSAPAELLRPVLPSAPEPQYLYRAVPYLQRMLGRFDRDGVDFVFRAVLTKPMQHAEALLPVEGSIVTKTMMSWLDKKSLRPLAFEWFDRHIASASASASADIVVAALGRPGPDRSVAEKALRTLARRGYRDELIEAASSFGPVAEDAIRAGVDADPLLQLPAKLPVLPEWLDPVLLPALPLRGTGASLPPGPVRNVCTMFALSRMDEVYAGVDIVRELVDEHALAEVAWALFERWSNAGFPDAQSWALDALGIVGNDETVRRLTPLIRTWPLQSAHRRAAAGLEVLATIGTDAALGHLWSISQGLRFPALREKADTRIRRIADELGLTRLELADRLVPHLGLDDNGTTTFDYGDRRFLVTFDHALRLVVHDHDGKNLARVPRPRTDDSDAARDEYRRYTNLKKDLESVRGELIARFETAMVYQRTWTMAQVRQHLVGHPLTWHLCSRLVWSTAEGAAFRFSELRWPVDVEGADVVVDDSEAVVVAHPLMLGDALPGWRDAFDAAGVVQPFEQLGRRVFTEDVGAAMTALEGFKTSTANLLALGSFGWKREAPQDKGAQIALIKKIDDDTEAVIMAFPGFNVSSPAMWAEQKIVHVFHTGGALLPIAASELLRDLSTIVTEVIRGDEPDLQGEP